MSTATTVTVASTVAGIVIGVDAAGLPIRLAIGEENRIPEGAWRSWLTSNFNSPLVASGRVKRIEKVK